MLSQHCDNTKKKELIGNLFREGKIYTTETVEVFDHDFPSLAEGVAIPHAITTSPTMRAMSSLEPVATPVSLPVIPFGTGGIISEKRIILMLTLS